MSSLVMTSTETLRYRGAIGQWSWVLHRLTGLGVLLFLYLHVIDTSWAVFYPDLYEKAIAIYQSPLFTIGEFGLVAAVVYHAYNGIRIGIFDYNPAWWRYQSKAAYIVLGLTLLTLIPTFILMFAHVLRHYEEAPPVIPLGDVLEAQLPFLVGVVVATVAAVAFSAIAGLVSKSPDEKLLSRPVGSKIERFWWSYMRISGLLILPLVFGHLVMIHIIQGVFDITLAGGAVVGTAGTINQSGTAVEFVSIRWDHLVAGVAIWRIYDVGLLALTAVHGFNGLRYVLTDYTMHDPLLRRASNYLCVVGAVALLVVGTAALLGSIDSSAIEIALDSQCRLGVIEACR